VVISYVCAPHVNYAHSPQLALRVHSLKSQCSANVRGMEEQQTTEPPGLITEIMPVKTTLTWGHAMTIESLVTKNLSAEPALFRAVLNENFPYLHAFHSHVTEVSEMIGLWYVIKFLVIGSQNWLTFEMCGLLGYYVALCGTCLPTFRDNVSVPSSRVKSPSRKESQPIT
jgi:hypothetical protein